MNIYQVMELEKKCIQFWYIIFDIHGHNATLYTVYLDVPLGALDCPTQASSLPHISRDISLHWEISHLIYSLHV